VLPSDEVPDEIAAAISEVPLVDGQVRVKMANRRQVLMDLAKLRG
jgi:hypothetical protein